MKDRLKELRKTLGLTQNEFGEKIGATRDAIAAYERGVTVKDPILKLICSTFKVDPFWLKEGTGEMFTAIPESIIDELVEEFDLEEDDRFIIESYVQAPKEQQKAIKDFFKSLANKIEKGGN